MVWDMRLGCLMGVDPLLIPIDLSHSVLTGLSVSSIPSSGAGAVPLRPGACPMDSLCLSSQSHLGTSTKKGHRDPLCSWISKCLGFGVGVKKPVLFLSEIHWRNCCSAPKAFLFVCQEGRSWRELGKSPLPQRDSLNYTFHVIGMKGFRILEKKNHRLFGLSSLSFPFLSFSFLSLFLSVIILHRIAPRTNNS